MSKKNQLYDWDQALETILQIAPKAFEDQGDVENQDIIYSLPKEVEDRLKNMPFNEEGRDPIEVFEELRETVYKYRTRLSHPKFFSFIPLPLSPVSVVGDFINQTYSPYGGSHTLSEGMALAEKRLLNWMGEQVGYSVPELGGVFVSGGSIANLTASVVARDEKLKDEEFPLGTIYISDQTHSSVAKGIHIMGIPVENTRKVASDHLFRMDPDELERMIQEDLAKGLKPFLIVGSCGTTNTGSIDPLDKLADIAEKYNMWYHIDGAYGATALLSSYKDQLKGIERSDSISWDGHKWLFQTYGCAAVICKDRQAMSRTFSANPEYLTDIQSEDANINFWDIGIELTKPARGMRLLYTLQVVGLKAMREAIDRGYQLAKYFEESFRKYDFFEIVSPAQLSVVNVRYVNDKYTEEELNKINSDLSQRASEKNKSIYYTTVLRDKLVLRFCSMHPLLKEEDIDEIVADIVKEVESLN